MKLTSSCTESDPLLKEPFDEWDYVMKSRDLDRLLSYAELAEMSESRHMTAEAKAICHKFSPRSVYGEFIYLVRSFRKSLIDSVDTIYWDALTFSTTSFHFCASSRIASGLLICLVNADPQ